MSKSKTVIVGIIAVAIIGAGVFYLTNNNKDTENNTTKSTDSSQNSQKTDAETKKFADACKVFTKEEIGVALGGTFSDGEEGISHTTATPGTPDYDNDDLRSSSCDFEQDNDGTTAGMTASISFSIEINNYKNAGEAGTYMSELRNPPTAEGQEAVSGATDVEGVGDQAFFPHLNTAEGTYEKTESLNVLVGRQVVILNVTKLDGVDRESVRSALTTLGKKL